MRRFKGTPRWPQAIQASVGAILDADHLQPRPNARYQGDTTTQPPQLSFKQKWAQAKRRKSGGR